MGDEFIRITSADGVDVDHAVAAWSLGWASVVALGYDEHDDPLIEIRMEDNWKSGPTAMVEWLKTRVSRAALDGKDD